jgi:hypothetical protein
MAMIAADAGNTLDTTIRRPQRSGPSMKGVVESMYNSVPNSTACMTTVTWPIGFVDSTSGGGNWFQPFATWRKTV